MKLATYYPGADPGFGKGVSTVAGGASESKGAPNFAQIVYKISFKGGALPPPLNPPL